MFFSRIRNIAVSLLLATLAGGCAAELNSAARAPQQATTWVIVNPQYAKEVCAVHRCTPATAGRIWALVPSSLAPTTR
jgi:hypothetical protein